MNKQPRITSLDGLRGVAALVVTLTHILFCLFYPEIYFGSDAAEHSLSDMFSESLLFVFINGSFAVAVFFVLSGFVIAYASANTSDGLFMLIGRRYLRLTLPITISVVLAFVLYSLFPDTLVDASRYLQNGWLSERVFDPIERLEIAIWQGVYNCFRFGEASINSPLWSMQIELFGSVLIYSIYAVTDRRYILWLMPVVASVIFFLGDSKALYLLGFCAGVMLFEAWDQGWLSRTKSSWVYLGIGLVFGSIPVQVPIDSVLTPIIRFIERIGKDAFPVLTSVGAAFLLLGVIKNEPLERFLSLRPAQFLGKISFCLYLTHWPVMATIGLFLFLHLQPDGVWFLLYIVSMLLLCILVAYVITVWGDEPAVKLLALLKGREMHPVSWLFGGCIFVIGSMIYTTMVGFHWMTISVLLIGGLGLTSVFNYAYTVFVRSSD